VSGLNGVPVCSRCKERLTEARLVVGGRWLCGACLYELEVVSHGPVERKRRRRRAVAVQTETLFEPDEYLRDRR